MLENERWQQLESLFDKALEMGVEQRCSMLEQLLEEDEELAAELAELIKCDRQAASFLEKPVLANAKSEIRELRQSLIKAKRPDHIGSYRIGRLLGEGGMSQVYLAYQDAPIRREVALKVMRERFYSDEMIARFQQEWQVLGSLKHNYIAKIFDAGISEGCPYFVMELIDGEPILSYCDAHQLSIRERVTLFTKVCDAIVLAHQSLIIHRDLKPANVMVTECNNTPVPKVIDFGVAKALGKSSDAFQTQGNAIIGTPLYMSPEQSIDGTADTRGDIYSMSMMLYELLVGTFPFDISNRTPLESILRAIREAEVIKPSQRLKSLSPEKLQACAVSRGVRVQQLVRALEPGLDLIMCKGLAKEPDLRYGSVSELKADLNRYLNHQPPLAAMPDFSYRCRKWLYRNKVAAITSSLVSAALLVGVGFAFLGYYQAIEAQAETARAITDLEKTYRERRAQYEFIEQMIISPHPDREGTEITMVEALKTAEQNLEHQFVGHPHLEASIRLALGRSYYGQAVYSKAADHLKIAVELAEGIEPRPFDDLCKALDYLGRTYRRLQDYQSSEHVFRQALAIQHEALGPGHPDRLRIKSGLASTLMQADKQEEAQWILRETLEAQRAALGTDHPDVMVTMNELARCMKALNHPGAESLFEDTLTLQECVLGDDHSQTLATYNNLANAYVHSGKYHLAEPRFRDLLARRRDSLGERHPRTLNAVNGLIRCLIPMGHLEEAELLSRHLIDARREAIGGEHPKTLVAMINHAAILANRGKSAEAIDIWRGLLKVYDRLGKSESRNALLVLHNLGDRLAKTGQYDEGFACLRKALALKSRRYGSYSVGTMVTHHSLADMFLAQGRTIKALEHYRMGLKAARKSLPADSPKISALQRQLDKCQTQAATMADVGPKLSDREY